MDDKIKAGDVWWSEEHDYGKIYLRCDPGFPKALRVFLFNGMVGHWEHGGLTEEGIKSHGDWVRLYNINDVTKLSREALNENNHS
jgi:hypothetical protein